MKANIRTSDLLTALKFAEKVGGNSELAIVDTTMTLRVVDSGIIAVINTPAEVETEGWLELPTTRLLREAAAIIKAPKVTVSQNAAGQLHLSAAKYDLRLKALPTLLDTPAPVVAIPLNPNALLWATKAATLRNLLEQVLYAAAPDMGRANINVVHVAFAERYVTCQATDGARMAVIRQELPAEIGRAMTYSLPLASTHILQNFLLNTPADATTELYHESNFATGKLVVRTPLWTMVIAPSATDFPRMDSIIKELKRTAIHDYTCNRKALLHDINTALLFTAEARAITVGFGDKLLTISAQGGGDRDFITTHSYSKMSTAPASLPDKYRIDGTFLADALRACKADEVTLHVGPNNIRPIAVLPAAEDFAGDPDVLHFFMPMTA